MQRHRTKDEFSTGPELGQFISDTLDSKMGAPLILGAVCLYLSVFVVTIHGRGDEGLMVYPAERVLAGQVPYRDFFSELAPGVFYIQALLFKLFGTHIWSARIPALLVLAAISWQLFYLGRKVMPAWAAIIPTPIYVTVAFSRWMIVSHHWYSLLFALATAICFVRFMERRRIFWLFLAGIFTAASGICMQTKGALLLLAATTVLLTDYVRGRKEASRAGMSGLASYLFGVFALAVVPLCYFFIHDSLYDFVYSTALLPAQNYLSYEFVPIPFLPGNLLKDATSVAADFSVGRAGRFFSSLIWSLIIPVLGAVCGLKGTLRRHSQDKEQDRVRALLFIYGVFGLGLWISEMHRFDFTHMLFGVPILLILTVKLLYEAGYRRAPASRFAALLLICFALFYLVQGVSLARRELRRNSPIQTRRGVIYQTHARAQRLQIVINSVQSRVSKGSEVFIYPYDSILYFLTGTVNPTRLDWLLPGETMPEQFEKVIQLLKSEEAPPFVFSFWKQRKRILPRLFPNVPREKLQQHPIEQFLLSSSSPYRVELEGETFVVFKRNAPR